MEKRGEFCIFYLRRSDLFGVANHAAGGTLAFGCFPHFHAAAEPCVTPTRSEVRLLCSFPGS